MIKLLCLISFKENVFKLFALLKLLMKMSSLGHFLTKKNNQNFFSQFRNLILLAFYNQIFKSQLLVINLAALCYKTVALNSYNEFSSNMYSNF